MIILAYHKDHKLIEADGLGIYGGYTRRYDDVVSLQADTLGYYTITIKGTDGMKRMAQYPIANTIIEYR